ncbi:sporulation protein YqfD [Faecalibacterium sp. I4-1-79]|uniref:sporulation protein YqfD n=1 Tax=Faecalibacterium sp. I4-1-79 TaxID=2929494 RepID=UPI002014A38A|nr:sporulation protein YqfD [Faecalibacterium sp. I4-1-79]UQK41616.1 sporulation protein YqfD [Faecalibacterium sp. I4-1-79]
MEAASLWAGVCFTARNGSPEALLTDAAAQGIHLYGISARPGGFCAHCAAWQYRRLAALARHRRVRLRVDKRKGLYFLLRPLLRRKGLWVGLAAWGLGLLWLQGLIWAVDYGSLTTGQRARAGAVLRSCGLQPGTAVTEELLRAGEYALLESGEFSWVSLNFEKGRLAVEAAPAHARPEIAAGTLHGLRAKCNGTVLRTNLASGTMLVVPGQTVEAGQGLIGTARSERDGTLIFAPAAGTVVAQLEWETNQNIPLAETLPQLTGKNTTNYKLFFAEHSAVLSPSAPDGDGLCRTRHLQLEVFGLPLPCAVEETIYYGQQQETMYRTEAQALTLARLQGLRALHDAFPDADILARREECTVQEEALHYNAVYTVTADICT